MMQWLRTVALACAVARAAGVVVIDSTTPSCALTTGEIGQLHDAKNYAELAAAAPCVLYDTAATAPPADVTELTVVQAGPAYCMEHLAGAKVAVDTLNALNANKGFAVGVAGDTFVRLRLVTILTAAEYDADAFHDEVVRAMLTSGGFAAAYGVPRYLIGTCNKGGFADAEKLASDDAGVILMAQIGPDLTYEGGLPNLFGMHLSSYSYSVPVLQQLRRSGAKKIAVVTSEHSNFFVTTCAFGKEYAQGKISVASTTDHEAPMELVYNYSYAPTADEDANLVPNRVDKDFLDGVATEVCNSGADVFMACVQIDEAELLIAKWEALDCVPDAVWLTSAAWGAPTGRDASDAHNYAAAGGQWFAAMPYADEFFATTTALVDTGEAQFGYRFDYDYVSSYTCVYVLYRALQDRYYNAVVNNLATELSDASGYAQLRANLARLEALETVFGPVRFDANQRNDGRNPGAIQVLPGADGKFSLWGVGPIEAAETQYVYPAPAALPCPLNTFANPANASALCFLCRGECARCPVGSTIWDTTLEDGKGAVSVASCYMCRAGEGILQGSDCEACPTGSWSPAGSSRCDVRAHYYRWRDDSKLYLCPAHDDACRGQRGDVGVGDALCAENARGPLCMLCKPNHHRVVSSRGRGRGRARCKSCGDWKGVAHVYVYLFVFVGAAIIVVIAARKILAREIRTVTDQLRAKSRLHGFDRALPTLWTVARQAIYTITVLSQVRSIERLTLPKPYANLVDVITSFAIDIDKYLGPLACFNITYYDELLFWTLLPPAALVVALVVAVGTVAARRVRGAPSGSEWRARRASRELPDALRRVFRAWIIACIYLHSFICGVIYKAFVCASPPGNKDEFLTHRGYRSFLRADYGLACGTEKHHTYEAYATLALIAYATFPAVLALRLWANRKSGQADGYLAFMTSHLRPSAWALECVAIWYRMILSGALWIFFRRDENTMRLGLSLVVVVLYVGALSYVRPYSTEGARRACSALNRLLLIFFCLAIVIKGEVFSKKEDHVIGVFCFLLTMYLFCGAAYNVWRADVRALVDGLQANRLDRFALRRLYEGAEKAVIGEAILEAALVPIETGVEENEERWEFVDRELLGWHDQTRDVLSDVWDDASDTEHLLPWLGEVRAQAARVMRSSSVVHGLRQAKGDFANSAVFAAAVESAAPWLSSWLAPHVAGAYSQVAPASEPLKPPDALLAFDIAVVRAIGGTETVDTVRKKLHGAAQTPKGGPHASMAVSASTKVANASSFAHALKRASCRMLGHGDPSTYAFVKHASPPRCSRYAVLAIRAKALALQADDAMATLAKEALDNEAGRAILDRGSVGTAADQPALVADALDAYVKTLGGEALRDRVDADALPEILHAMARGAFDAFKSALEAILVPGSSLMGDCDARTAVKSLARIRAKLQEYRAEEQRWPACARVQDPLRATILCKDSAVMLEALKKVEAPPFKLLRLKNNLASEKKPFNLHAVLEFAPVWKSNFGAPTPST